MSETIVVQSHKGPYEVEFVEAAFAGLNDLPLGQCHFIVDAKVAKLYPKPLASLAKAGSVLTLEATEDAKSLERMPGYVESLMKGGLRRGQQLVAIGGGIVQDATAFLASTILRGVDWTFFPTTLLAQADSCIGSKSSINVSGFKNIVGTFHPPRRIIVSAEVLRTLESSDVRSGVGEMIKVHALAGLDEFERIARRYDDLFTDDAVMLDFIKRSLLLKRPQVELDEFDATTRLVLNYGHTFGHAIESATHFAIPHGLAVCFGMDMANFVSRELSLSDGRHFDAMHDLLRKNTTGFSLAKVGFDVFLGAFLKDKKHATSALRLVLPDKNGGIGLTEVANDDAFRRTCQRFLELG